MQAHPSDYRTSRNSNDDIGDGFFRSAKRLFLGGVASKMVSLMCIFPGSSRTSSRSPGWTRECCVPRAGTWAPQFNTKLGSLRRQGSQLQMEAPSRNYRRMADHHSRHISLDLHAATRNQQPIQREPRPFFTSHAQGVRRRTSGNPKASEPDVSYWSANCRE